MKYFYLLLMFAAGAAVLSAQWESVSFQDAGGLYSASSELDKPESPAEIGRYSPRNLFDHNTATAWVEGEAGSGSGSYVLTGVSRGLKKYLIIYNGYQQTESLFKKNNRVRELKISLYAGYSFDAMAGQFGFEAESLSLGEPVTVTLDDTIGPQRFKLPFDPVKAGKLKESGRRKFIDDFSPGDGVKDFFFLKFEIVSVYPGTKWDDTCISGIEFTDNPLGIYIPVNEKIKTVFKDSKSGDIMVRTTSGQVLTLIQIKTLAEELRFTAEGEFFDADAETLSPDNEWAVINYQHGYTYGGRVEETRKLWSVRRMEEVPDSLLESYNIDTPADFTEKNGRFYLETMEGSSVLLDDIGADMDNRD